MGKVLPRIWISGLRRPLAPEWPAEEVLLAAAVNCRPAAQASP
jgi:hypothetical protein